LEERRGKSIFSGEYSWSHYGSYQVTFDAAFIRFLNDSSWVPDPHGSLGLAQSVVFDSLGWPEQPFLLSKIRFRPALLDQLAREAGIEPAIIDLLKRLGLTSEAELKARLGIDQEPIQTNVDTRDSHDGSAAGSDRVGMSEHAPNRGESGVASEPGRSQGRENAAGRSGGTATQHVAGEAPAQDETPQGQPSATTRPFISYVGVHHIEDEPDPDGLDQMSRMALEAKAIDFILSKEEFWRRTPPFNPGFDLFAIGADGQPNRWCEVKAMTGCLTDRPVGLSRAQFDFACAHGSDYSLYIVEHASAPNPRIVRIQSPGLKARTFTFDHGWMGVAELL